MTDSLSASFSLVGWVVAGRKNRSDLLRKYNIERGIPSTPSIINLCLYAQGPALLSLGASVIIAPHPQGHNIKGDPFSLCLILFKRDSQRPCHVTPTQKFRIYLGPSTIAGSDSRACQPHRIHACMPQICSSICVRFKTCFQQLLKKSFSILRELRIGACMAPMPKPKGYNLPISVCSFRFG